MHASSRQLPAKSRGVSFLINTGLYLLLCNLWNSFVLCFIFKLFIRDWKTKIFCLLCAYFKSSSSGIFCFFLNTRIPKLSGGLLSPWRWHGTPRNRPQEETRKGEVGRWTNGSVTKLTTMIWGSGIQQSASLIVGSTIRLKRCVAAVWSSEVILQPKKMTGGRDKWKLATWCTKLKLWQRIWRISQDAHITPIIQSICDKELRKQLPTQEPIHVLYIQLEQYNIYGIIVFKLT